MKIALKFTVVLFAGIVLLLGIVLVLDVRRETALFESDMVSDNSFLGKTLAVVAGVVARTGGREAVLAFVHEADEAGPKVELRVVEVSDAAGAIPVPGDAGGAQFRIDRPRHEIGMVRTFVPLPTNMGILELDESLRDEKTYVRNTVIRHVLTAAAIAGLCAAVALALGLAIVGRPVSRMVAQARRVGAGDLAGRLSPQGGDELADLGREIDTMTAALAEAARELEAETAAKIETLEQLRRADRLATVGKLASGIAHELGTPLNVVAARAKMIATGEVEGPSSRESASVVMEQAGRMSRIIRQVLDFARPRRPMREPVDLWQLARQVSVLLGPMGHQRGVNLEISDGRTPIAASVDAGQMQQVISNLVLNAIQAGRNGGRIVVRAEARRARPPADRPGPEGEYAVLSVEDNGPGIPETHLVHIFEPFFTTKDVGEGTGLGLSVSNGIVREHGGWIGVSSRPGLTRFEVFLPREGA